MTIHVVCDQNGHRKDCDNFGCDLEKKSSARASMYQSLLHIRRISQKSTPQAARRIASSMFLLTIVACPFFPVANAQFRRVR
jgi:hypothetical protein